MSGPDAHAKLAPSAAERWIECPASVRMEEELEPIAGDGESVYAREGTIAHALAELKASRAFGKIDEGEYWDRREQWRAANLLLLSSEVMAEMDRHTDAYVTLLEERMALYPNSVIFFEERLDTGVPFSWGTSDAVIVSPQHVEIVDFKYGQGVAVEAAGNPQLRLYACGAMDTYADLLGETELIRATVHQPRMNHVLTEELTPAELRTWRETVVLPRAELALSDDAPFGPSETACRWCAASGRCQAQLQEVFAEDFTVEPDTLDADQIAEILPKLPFIKSWLTAFEEAALHTAYSEGIDIPGFKVVLSGGRRTFTDPVRAVEVLLDAGLKFSEVAKTAPRGIGELEKLLGKERFRELLETNGLVQRGEGRPSLVKEDDGRPAVAPESEAQKEFS